MSAIQDVVIESDRAWWNPVLQQLAWVMMQGEKPTEFRVAIPREEAVRAIAQFLNGKVPYAEDFARKCLRDLQKHHLIQAGKKSEELEFRHQLIQEYYAAEALLEQLPKLDDERLKREFLNFLKWTEPVALMLTLVDEVQQVLRVVEQALEVDWRLAARLAGEVQQEFQGHSISLIDALNTPRWLKIELLGETKSTYALMSLLKLLEDPNYSEMRFSVWEYGDASSALGKIGSEQAIPTLLELIEHSNTYVRGDAASALSKIGSEQAVSGLLKLLKDANSDVRIDVMFALGKLGSEQAIPTLLSFVEHFNDVYRTAFILGEIRNERAVPALLQLLKDSYSDIRYAVSALGEIRSERAIPVLLQLLKNSNSDLQQSVVSALGKIGSERAVPVLLKLLKDSNSTVRMGAASALGKIGSEKAIPALLKLIKFSNPDVRRSAASALGKIGSEKAIFGLLECIKNSDSGIRRDAAFALGGIGSEQAVPGLLKLLEDCNYDVHKSAVFALAEIGSKKAIPALLQLLEDCDVGVRDHGDIVKSGV